MGTADEGREVPRSGDPEIPHVAVLRLVDLPETQGQHLVGEPQGHGEEVPAVTYVPDSVFVAGGTESELGITMTQEVLDGRAY